MHDFWSNLTSMPLEESNAVDFLREQARLLGKKTDGVVRATFSILEYRTPTPGIAVAESVGKALSAAFSREEILEEELSSKTDARALDKETTYKFEIYSDTYRFRLFILTNRQWYPINIQLDEGISQELYKQSNIQVNNSDDFLDLIAAVFSSKKVTSIINKMIAVHNSSSVKQ